ncbi:LLM class flavin-dependent oxidoreductase [Kumtagia ephedrae]|uniref:LLM class flavin-dependent oxidoreductase n=1 Tax=Kumtagia ephedrae TaxID=2116701 RepID=A0A2P7S4W5_9HYPH|nr:LLM class flavin-dependent oxidoreductase [Mesorhizobium ephedrae]PSJ57449.1 LLM class flavin-dependent oxidoreductase [Mesorhizobium ephedrae]
MRLGIYTFGDLRPDPVTGKTISPAERMAQMMEMAKLADEAGLDLIGVGEHHGLDYVNSATAVQLAAIGTVTKRIRLSSATTLIATADPVRTFQEFATADLLSGGRVEIIVGRGAFNDNYALFGHDMADYDALFVEKLDLLERLNTSERITWRGQFRSPLSDAPIAPRPAQPRLPISVGAVSPASVQRVAREGYRLTLPLLGGLIPRYGQLAELYRTAWTDRGRSASARPEVAVFGHAHVSTKSGAMADFFPYYSAYLEPLFKGSIPQDQYRAFWSPTGSLIAGSPLQVVDKLSLLHEATGCDLFAGQIDIGAQPFSQVLRGIELLATQVSPSLRNLGNDPADSRRSSPRV